jgi:hypothetical protein
MEEERIAIVFKLDQRFISVLKEKARRENIKLNDYVERLLLDGVYSQPNKAVESGDDLDTLDVDNFEEYVRSL